MRKVRGGKNIRIYFPLHRIGGKQPEMKRQAILREKRRDKETGYLKEKRKYTKKNDN
jgi:hypothetical protein